MNPTEPRNMRLTRPGESNAIQTRSYPTIYGGVCEACGVIDPNYPGEVQYKFCKHYKGMDMKCVFCKENADHADVVRMSTVLVKEDPYAPGNLVTLCGSYECTRKFEAKYHITPR